MKSLTFKTSTHTSILFLFLILSLGLLIKSQSSEAAGAGNEAVSTASVRALPLRDEVTAVSAKRGNPWVNYQNGREAASVYKGAAKSVMAAAAVGAARPLALASADFDGDGFADLVAGYSAFGGGALAIHRSNPDAFGTSNPETAAELFEARFPSPFRADSGTVQTQLAPDYLSVGDFNNDGYQDIVLAAKGGQGVSFLLGDGRGSFRATEPMMVPGTITSMFASNIDWWKGTADLMIGVEGAEGPKLLVYSDANATWEATPAVIDLPAAATAITAGVVDNRPMPDVVVAAGRNVVIAHPGYGPNGSHLVEQVAMHANVRDVQVGQFVWNRDNRRTIAALTDDGSISIVSNGSLDQRPYTESEQKAIKSRRMAQRDVESRASVKAFMKTLVKAGRTAGWVEGERFTASAGATQIFAATLSSGLTDDLLVRDAANKQLRVIIGQQGMSVNQDASQSSAAASDSFGERPDAITIDVSNAPLAVLPMKVNFGTRNGLVVLQEGKADPTIIPAAPLAIFSVNTTADTTTCAGTCSLRGATIASNATAGPNQINLPAGTYTLTLSAGPIQGDAKTFDNEFFFCGGFVQGGGDLDLGGSDVTIAGSGAPIIQAGSTAASLPTNGNGIDRVLGVNDCGTTSPNNPINVTLSNLTIRNGKSPENDPDNNPGTINSFFHEGGGIVFEAVNWQTLVETGRTLTLTGVTITQNFAAGQGGGIKVITGAMNVNTSSVISNNLSYHTKGGGICYDGLPAAAPARTLQVANSTVSGNSSLFNPVTNFPSNAGEGGGIQAAGGTGVTITNTNVNGTNHAALRGGGIAIANSPLVVITGGSISGNTSRGDGGGLWTSARVPSSNALSTVTINGLNISGNTADSDNAITADAPTGNGGGILNFFGNMTLGNTTAVNITGNAAINGGGVYTTWTQNTNDASAGFNMTNGAIGQTGTGNNARNNGGGIAVVPGNATTFGTVTLVTTLVQANTANSDSSGGGDGGGIYVETGSINPLNGVTIDSNVANAGNGDGIRLAGGSISATNTINVNNGDSLYLSAGTFTSTTGALNLTGNFMRDTANTFTPNNGTVNWTGTGAQVMNGTATATTFFNFVVNKSNTLSTGGSLATVTTNNLTMTAGTFSAPATLDVNGQVLLSSGSTLNAGASILANLNWTNDGGTFNPGSGTVTFDGGGAQSIQGTAPSQTFNNLIVNKGGASTLNTAGSTTSLTVNNLTETLGNFTAPATLDINGNMTLTAGTFTAGANITAGGNWVHNGGTFTPGAGTVTFDGGTANTIGGTVATQTFNNFAVNKPGGSLTGLTSLTTLTLNGSMTITAGTLAAGTITTLNTAANWSNSGTFTAGSSTVIFNGNNNTQTLSGATTFNNLTSNHTGMGSVTAAGSTLTVTALMRVQAGTFTSSSTFNNVQIDSGATLASDGSTMNVSGNWTNNGGTFTPNGNTVNFNGGAAQSIGGTSVTQTFNNFTVNKTGILSVVASTTTLDINGAVTLTAGAFASGTAATMTVAGNWTNNGGSFTAGTGTVTFDGSAGQAIGGTTATTFNNLTNSNASGLAMNNTNNVNATLALTSGDITVASGQVLIQPSTVVSTGTFDVVGSVRRTNTPNPLGTAALTFGNPNNIITFTAAGTRPIDVTVNLVKTVPVGVIGFPNAVARHYTITPNGGTGYSATLRLRYLDSELNGNIDTGGALNLWQFNGIGWAPRAKTAFDATANWVEKSGVTAFSPWAFNSTLAPTATDGTVTGRISNRDGSPISGAVIRLSGSQGRKAITDANGTYTFHGIDTSGFYTVSPSRANYTFSPASRSFNQLGQNTEASFSANNSGDSVNPLDTAEYFVRQQYVDLLGREPDEGGFNYWSDRILECGDDNACVNARRRDVAAAFFIEQEYQKSGSYVQGLYKGALGRNPLYVEFVADRQQLAVGANLEATKQALAEAFVGRAEFVTRYQDNVAAESFVDALIQSIQTASGVDLSSQRAASLAKYATGSSLNQSRSLALRELTEEAAFVQAEYNGSFVLTEYFAYLRRDPDAGGYSFWVNVLNNREPGNFRGMVCAFINSAEYQQRFSSVISRTDQECQP